MNVESTVRPNPVTIEQYDNDANVILCENIIETQKEDSTIYTYDEYHLTVPYRDNLFNCVSNGFESWLNSAKEQEYNKAAAEVRARRDKLLAATDFTMCTDVPFADGAKEVFRAYRQALRDIPEQEGFPFNVIFPNKPV